MKTATRRGADEIIITALTTGASQAEAARQAGVARRTVERRMTEPAFRARVTAARAAVMERAIARLTDRMDAAVDALTGLLSDPNPFARLGAASKILDAALRGREQVELEGRLAALEEQETRYGARTRGAA